MQYRARSAQGRKGRGLVKNRGGFYLAEALEQRCLLSAAAQLAFAQQPTSAIVGTAFSPAVVVDVEDSSGNIVTTDQSNVTLGFSVGPVGGAISGTLTIQAHNGVATECRSDKRFMADFPERF
jgi:hypothetical protein